MAYRTRLPERMWSARRLPGGCLSIAAVLGMVGAIGLGAFVTLLILTSMGIGGMGAMLLPAVVGTFAAIGFLFAFFRLEAWFASLLPLAGRLAVEHGAIDVRVPGWRKRRLRFAVDDLDVRCSSLGTSGDDEGTTLVLRSEAGVAVCTSRRRIRRWAGPLRIEAEALEVPDDAPRLELEPEAMEELLRSIEDELERH